MSRGTSAIRDTGEEARWKSGKRRKEGIIHERAMGEREREREEKKESEREEYPEVVTHVAMELSAMN